MNTLPGIRSHYCIHGSFFLSFFAIPLGFVATTWMAQAPVFAQATAVKPANEDEAKVDMGDLPDPLIDAKGKKVSSPQNWDEQRQYLIDLISTHQYGFAPSDKPTAKVELINDSVMQNGTVRCRQLRITWSTSAGKCETEVALFLPAPKNGDKAPALKGCFVGLNFRGNQSLSFDPSIRVSRSWMADKLPGVVNHQATEESRGSEEHRLPVEEITKRGYAVATAYYGDIDPDFDDGFQNGVHALYPEHKPDADHPSRWGSIAAWSWGLSRIVDQLELQPELKQVPFAVFGHSRLGKAALCAGVNDTRFRLVISNNSGCGGAGIERREFGETVHRINTVFPHWFCPKFKEYNANERALPHDAHTIIAACAPRAVYIASASKDLWADPKGEYLAGWYATPVYRLHGLNGLPSLDPPATEQQVGDQVGYHSRNGKHDLTSFDWEKFMDFADRVLARK